MFSCRECVNIMFVLGCAAAFFAAHAYPSDDLGRLHCNVETGGRSFVDVTILLKKSSVVIAELSVDLTYGLSRFEVSFVDGDPSVGQVISVFNLVDGSGSDNENRTDISITRFSGYDPETKAFLNTERIAVPKYPNIFDDPHKAMIEAIQVMQSIDAGECRVGKA